MDIADKFAEFDRFYDEIHATVGAVAEQVKPEDLDGNGNGLCEYMDFLALYETGQRLKKGEDVADVRALVHSCMHRAFEFGIGFAIQRELR